MRLIARCMGMRKVALGSRCFPTSIRTISSVSTLRSSGVASGSVAFGGAFAFGMIWTASRLVCEEEQKESTSGETITEKNAVGNNQRLENLPVTEKDEQIDKDDENKEDADKEEGKLEDDEEGEESENEDENDTDTSPEWTWDYTPTPRDYMAVFLDKESSDKLRERFPPLFPNESYDHMTVVFEPSREQVLDQDDLLGDENTIHIIAYAQDDHCQTLLVEVEHPHVQSQNKFAHITLSCREKDDSESKYSSKYSNTLLHRLAAEKDARRVFYLRKNDDAPATVWHGTLPEAGTFQPSRASILNVQEEEITVSGLYCLKSNIDREDGLKCTYRRENQCGFCKFMKGGPCRQVFTVWEKCVAESKDESEEGSFIDRCTNQTMALKECVDAYPNYYDVLGKKGDDQEQNDDDDLESDDAIDDGDNDDEIDKTQ